MPPLIEGPSTSPAAPLSHKTTPPPPSKKPHLSSPFFSPISPSINERYDDDENDEDARLASLITDNANWPAWNPIQEVWMSGGLGRRGGGKDRETKEVKSEDEGFEEGKGLFERGEAKAGREKRGRSREWKLGEGKGEGLESGGEEGEGEDQYGDEGGDEALAT